jgi:hypothetical protein
MHRHLELLGGSLEWREIATFPSNNIEMRQLWPYETIKRSLWSEFF